MTNTNKVTLNLQRNLILNFDVYNIVWGNTIQNNCSYLQVMKPLQFPLPNQVSKIGRSWIVDCSCLLSVSHHWLMYPLPRTERVDTLHYQTQVETLTLAEQWSNDRSYLVLLSQWISTHTSDTKAVASQHVCILLASCTFWSICDFFLWCKPVMMRAPDWNIGLISSCLQIVTRKHKIMPGAS